jgi:hypothetical protein
MVPRVSEKEYGLDPSRRQSKLLLKAIRVNSNCNVAKVALPLPAKFLQSKSFAGALLSRVTVYHFK